MLRYSGEPYRVIMTIGDNLHEISIPVFWRKKKKKKKKNQMSSAEKFKQSAIKR